MKLIRLLGHHGQIGFPAGFLLLFLLTRTPTLLSSLWSNAAALSLNRAISQTYSPTYLAQAETRWMQATTIKSDNVRAWRGLGFVNTYQGQTEQALENWYPAGNQTIAIELQQWGQSAIWQNDSTAAQTWYTYITQLTPNNASAWFHLGQMHYRNNNHTAAHTAYHTAHTLGHNTHQLHLSHAEIHRQQQQWGQALTHYQQALTFQPNHYWANLYTGLMHWYAHRNFDQAQHHLNIAITLDPNSPHAYRLLGQIHQQLGQTEQAIANYTTLLTLDPTNTSITEQLIQLLHPHAEHLRQQQQWAQALTHYQQLSTLQPHDYWINAYTGLMYWYAHNNTTQAENYLNIAITLNPNHTYAHRQLGQIYQRLGQTEQAINAYNNVLALDPTDQFIQNQLQQLQNAP